MQRERKGKSCFSVHKTVFEFTPHSLLVVVAVAGAVLLPILFLPRIERAILARRQRLQLLDAGRTNQNNIGKDNDVETERGRMEG